MTTETATGSAGSTSQVAPSQAAATTGAPPAGTGAASAPANPDTTTKTTTTGTTPAVAPLLGQKLPAEGKQQDQQQATQQDGASKDGSQGESKDQKAQAEQEIEITLPKGVELDPELLGGFKPLAKEFGLKSEQAQKLVDLVVARQQAAVAQAQEAWVAKVNEEWAGQIKADKEIGGKHFDASVVAADKAFRQFFDADTRQWLLESGYANHPGLFRALVRVGKAISEDSIAGAGGSEQRPMSEEELALQLFPSMRKG